jgi:hypothetical protein
MIRKLLCGETSLPKWLLLVLMASIALLTALVVYLDYHVEVVKEPVRELIFPQFQAQEYPFIERGRPADDRCDVLYETHARAATSRLP